MIAVAGMVHDASPTAPILCQPAIGLHAAIAPALAMATFDIHVAAKDPALIPTLENPSVCAAVGTLKIPKIVPEIGISKFVYNA